MGNLFSKTKNIENKFVSEIKSLNTGQLALLSDSEIEIISQDTLETNITIKGECFINLFQISNGNVIIFSKSKIQIISLRNNTEYDTCHCGWGFTQIGNSSCFRCSNGCSECKYDILNIITECARCNSNYALDSNKNCIYCGEGCGFCELDAKNNPICKYCYSGSFSSNNKCLVCSSGCSKCYML